jgi:hypothetical protein
MQPVLGDGSVPPVDWTLTKDFPGVMSEAQVIDCLKEHRLTALIKCQVCIPPERWGECLELGPIFVNREITLQDLKAPLNPQLRQYYPYMPADENANVWMTE